MLATAELIKKVGSLEVTAASELEDGKKKRKAIKDPNAPKRPPGSYFLFSNDRRSKLASEKPNLNNNEIMALLADEWSKLGEKQKKVRGIGTRIRRCCEDITGVLTIFS